MHQLRVAADQLLATANGWHGLTSELLTTATPSELGFSSQASAAAVDAVHAGVAAAAEAFAARTQITAVKTAAASFAYASMDANSRDLLRAIGESL
ncbi:hypothetical protein [Mycobacterium xenopi]|uniref:Uncharacterized protein n=2 Tax=Mycobacterium xenopi TaxID=1789 RepID=A0AAD1H075_MYCXE|nr:hypothetical protein [Mycobacterium xenopi]MDA3639765.1 hypothetical protein [Mycobacterium xenopi]MDA3658125.1 hypothetical protein [Mycobacterium xenopi]MDA3662002.1 hypothetical protein [Mycobacterium xenopi]ORX20967.1 hypothetical protein AWC32_03015 [Mycobacterium xenopi]SPX78275.1 Uncharacterised protein [Mycobacterium xenopi]